MSQTTAHPLVDAYRKRLAAAVRRLPRAERRDLLEAFEEHLAAGEREAADDADIRNMLEDLGDPEDIVAAARPADRLARRLGLVEVAAVTLLLVGAFFPPLVGWIVGVALLWSSPAWPASKKWLGTLVVPGGLAAPLLLAWWGPSRMECTAGPPWAPPAPALPPPPGVERSGGVIEGTVRMCSAEPLLAGWPGVMVALVLVAASVAVAVHLLRTANAPDKRGATG